MRKLVLLLYIDLDPAIIICGAFYHCHLLEKKLGERVRFGPLKQNYRRHDSMLDGQSPDFAPANGRLVVQVMEAQIQQYAQQ
jgi:hypothetical protein